MVRPEDVKTGKVFLYKQQPVRVTEDAWHAGEGLWRCRSENLWTGAAEMPWTSDLSVGAAKWGPL